MPFYAWRPFLCEDHRRYAHGGPLRNTVDVSFLNRQSGYSPQVLCEAHLTCVISGSDDQHWVAYFFTDTYFDGKDEARETVLEYDKDKRSDHGMNADPLTYGNVDADVDPVWDPRKYFLTIVQHRLGQVTREWCQVVTNLRESFYNFEQVRCLLSYHNLKATVGSY
ncbi:uncharacterized protein A1O5_08412 [Cladophialophora psammophila CBS 110553]|uniref:Uncharacterized protein n=1 Tax=Cladophialophora psammophila CBS 110553 TaxID=1182543 RepID=W9WL26_9EURO|nr:uncharacterized protein A1O5_08412 [Cladophialophora psammophila CBS 110553]EXJ68618.1 hypothetical protein A1O5_08412 [Cladophialophora psammophila CBS 110553]